MTTDAKRLAPDDVISIFRTKDGVKAMVHLSTTDVSWPLHHVRRHSPTGFEFGYGGSGPADLALSILTACLPAGVDESVAERLHQDFKWEVVAKQKGDSWKVSCEWVREWVRLKAAAL